MDKGFVFYFIVRSLPEDLKNILELFSVWRYEEDTSTSSSYLERSMKVHFLMVKNNIWCSLLELCPLGYEICECLRLDGFVGSEIYVECSELNCPLGYASNCILVV
jgi:hypothetical protein